MAKKKNRLKKKKARRLKREKKGYFIDKNKVKGKAVSEIWEESDKALMRKVGHNI